MKRIQTLQDATAKQRASLEVCLPCSFFFFFVLSSMCAFVCLQNPARAITHGALARSFPGSLNAAAAAAVAVLVVAVCD